MSYSPGDKVKYYSNNKVVNAIVIESKGNIVEVHTSSIDDKEYLFKVSLLKKDLSYR